MISLQFINKHKEKLHQAGIPATASVNIHLAVLFHLKNRIKAFKNRMKKEINLIKNDYFSNIITEKSNTVDRIISICIGYMNSFTDYSNVLNGIQYYPVEIFGKLSYSIPEWYNMEICNITESDIKIPIIDYIASDINLMRRETNMFILDRMFL